MIRTERLYVEPVKVRDAEYYFKEFNEDIVKYQFAKPFKSVKEAADLINNFIELSEDNINLMLNIINEEKKFVGSIEIYGLYKEYPEVGIWICLKEQRKGYASEGLRAVADFLIKNTQAKGLIYEADIRNKASIKLIEKLGGFKIDFNNVYDSGKKLKLAKFIIS